MRVRTKCKELFIPFQILSNQILLHFLPSPSPQFYKQRLHLNFTPSPTRVNSIRKTSP